MKDAKLIQILQTFTPGELKRFREFIGAEFNHVPANLLALLDNIVKEGIGTELTKESLWVSVYGDMPYNDGKLRAGFSQLSKIAEEFLAFIGWQKNSGVKMTYLLNELNKRGLDKHFKSTLKRVQGEFSSGLVDTSLLLAEHLVMAEEVQFQYKQLGRSKKIDLLPASKTLDHFYVLTKLKYACQAINFQTVLNTSFDISFIDVIEKYVVDNEKLPSIIRVYHGLLQLLRSPENEELYHYVAGLIEQYKNGFSKAELWGMIGYLINYCIRRANQGTPDFLNHLLKWYKEALKEELLLENGTLSHWNYKNIVSVGLQVEEFDWVRKFLEKYKEALSMRQRENLYDYNLARYYFALGEYSSVLDILHRVEYEDVFYTLDSKMILAKTYYELEEVEPLGALLDSFSMFVRRNKEIGDYHKTTYLNFVRFLKRLTHLASGDAKKRHKLREEIEQTPQVADIKWLLKTLTSGK